MAFVQEPVGEVRAEEPGSAGNKYAHGQKLFIPNLGRRTGWLTNISINNQFPIRA
jgi:hypothetical protein